MLVGRTTRHRRRHRLVKEGHWKITKVEQTRFNSIALLEMLLNPSRWLLGKPALTCAADDYRDRCHVFILFCFCAWSFQFVAHSGGRYPSSSTLQMWIMSKSQSGQIP